MVRRSFGPPSLKLRRGSLRFLFCSKRRLVEAAGVEPALAKILRCYINRLWATLRQHGRFKDSFSYVTTCHIVFKIQAFD